MKKAYSKYQKVDIPWLNEMPEGWQEIGLNLLFKENRVKNSGMVHDTILSLSYGRIIIKEGDRYSGLTPESFETYQVLSPGYIILRLTDLQNDKRSLRVGLVRNRGIITSAYVGLIPQTVANSEYYYYLLHFLDKIKFFYNLGGGVRQSSSYSEISKLKFPLPPLPEQRQIAAFLDHKCALIDTFIEKKSRLIELLKEQKQAIINKAVTKGIDPDVPLKPSGIEWLGDIPAHWEVKKLKYLANLKSGSNLTSEVIQEKGPYPVYGGNGLRGYYPEFTHEGDYILIGRQGALCGNINYARGRFWPTEHAWVVNIKNGAHYFWLGELLRAMNLNQYSQSAAQPGLSIDNVKNLPMPVPSIADQKRMAEYLIKEFEKIAKTISQLEKEIDLINEYKTTLIAEAVTGKIDVREWQPKQAGETTQNPRSYASNQ